MITKKDETVDNQNDQDFESKLSEPSARFLAHVIEHGIGVGRRSAEDFLRHFSPAQIMAGLEARPNLRADILEPTTGTKRKIAVRKSAASAGEDLQIAMDEGEATAEQVVQLISPDDRVRYLDNKLLWSFVVEGDFWRVDGKSGPVFEQAKNHIAFILDRALIDGLVSHADVIGGVSIDNLAQSLPREMLASIIKASLEQGRQNKAFTEKELFETAASQILVEDMSLQHIWDTVIEPKIAQAHGFSAPIVVELEESQESPDAEANASDSETGDDEQKVEAHGDGENVKAGDAVAEKNANAVANKTVETKNAEKPAAPQAAVVAAKPAAGKRQKRTESDTAQLAGTIEVTPPTAMTEVKAAAMNVEVSAPAITKASAKLPSVPQNGESANSTAAAPPKPVKPQGSNPIVQRAKTDSWSVSSNEALDDLGDAIEELEVDEFEIEEEFETSPPTAAGPSPIPAVPTA